MIKKNTRVGALAVTLAALVVTQEALPADSQMQKGRALGKQTSQTDTTGSTGIATTSASGKPVKMNQGKHGVISRLNAWFNNPRPTDPKWQARVQEQIAVLRT